MRNNYVNLDNYVGSDSLTNIDSLILKIKQSAANINLKDWMEDYHVPSGTVPSALSFGECMRKALLWREDQKLNDFPSTRIAHYLETRDLTVSVGQIEVSPSAEDVLSENTVLVNRQSFYFKEDKEIDDNVIAAQASDYLAYLARLDGTYSVTNTFAMSTCAILLTKYVDTTDVMANFKNYLEEFPGGGLRSPTLIREALYAHLKTSKNFSFFLWSVFNERTGCGEFDQKAAELVAFCRARNERLPPARGFTHVIRNLPFPDCELMDLMYIIHHNHTQARGDDKGAGAIASTYYWNTFSKSMSKIMFNVVSVLDICLRLRIYIVSCESGLLTDYEVQMLNFNNITVICSDFGPSCKENDKVGVYGSTSLPYVYFTKLKGSPPKISGASVQPQYDVQNLVNLIPKDVNSFFVRVHMHPGLEKVVKELNLFLHPVLNCHRPEVYVTNVQIFKVVDIKDLIQRCVKANYYKTMFPMNKLPFGIVDEFAPLPFFHEKLKFPRRGGKAYVPIKYVTIKEASKNATVRSKFAIPDAYDIFDSDEEVEPAVTVKKDEVADRMIRNELNVLSSKEISDDELKRTRVFNFYKGLVQNNSLLVPSTWMVMYNNLEIEDFEEDFKEYAGILSRFDSIIRVPEAAEKLYENQRVQVEKKEPLPSSDLVDTSGLTLTIKKKRKEKKKSDED